jgi:hypothetical protein
VGFFYGAYKGNLGSCRVGDVGKIKTYSSIILYGKGHLSANNFW